MSFGLMTQLQLSYVFHTTLMDINLSLPKAEFGKIIYYTFAIQTTERFDTEDHPEVAQYIYLKMIERIYHRWFRIVRKDVCNSFPFEVMFEEDCYCRR